VDGVLEVAREAQEAQRRLHQAHDALEQLAVQGIELEATLRRAERGEAQVAGCHEALLRQQAKLAETSLALDEARCELSVVRAQLQHSAGAAEADEALDESRAAAAASYSSGAESGEEEAGEEDGEWDGASEEEGEQEEPGEPEEEEQESAPAETVAVETSSAAPVREAGSVDVTRLLQSPRRQSGYSRLCRSVLAPCHNVALEARSPKSPKPAGEGSQSDAAGTPQLEATSESEPPMGAAGPSLSPRAPGPGTPGHGMLFSSW
jgi:hypothetical protein